MLILKDKSVLMLSTKVSFFQDWNIIRVVCIQESANNLTSAQLNEKTKTFS
jgi:hypothetical protein